MTTEQQQLYLIKHLLSENPRYSNIDIPTDKDDRRNLLRSLLNVRPAEPISDEFLHVQDEYLQKLIAKNGIVDSEAFTPAKLNDKIYLWQGDITKLKVDAIVNAANSAMLGCFQPCHNCIDNIIHTLSGVQLRLACNDIMDNQGHSEPTGCAKITSAYNLPSKYILHTVGPIITGELTDNDKDLLANCYTSCLTLAEQNGVSSVAFCCISTGVFMFPQDEAAKIAVKTVEKFLKDSKVVKKVIFNVFLDSDKNIYEKLLNS